MKRRAAGEPATLSSFTDEFWVVCPRCTGRALVRRSSETRPARFTCLQCGASRAWVSSTRGVLTSNNAAKWPRGQYALGDAADPYFHLPLWLQMHCANELLWAYNERHLDFIHDYVGATTRSRSALTPGGPRNALLESRLPRWMKLGQNRDAVLAAIQKLKVKK